MNAQWVWITVFMLCPILVQGGKILVFPMDGSHWVNMKIIVEALHSRGHEITVVRSPDSWYIKENSPLYTSLTLEMNSGFDEDSMKEFVRNLIDLQLQGRSGWARFKLEMEQGQAVREIHEIASKMIEQLLENKDLIQSLQDAKYDLILTDPVLPTGVIIAHYIKLPLVYNVRWTSHGEGHFSIAPSPLSYVPMPGTEISDKMSFYERVINVISYSLAVELSKFILPYDSLIKKYFGPDAELHALLQAADLWLMRVDFVFEFPRPTMPNVIYMGGFQCKPAKPLPDDLEDFVQTSGEHGVIIMSLGTMIGELPEELTEVIAAAFAKVPQKVIWRHTGKKPASLGNNTLLVDWMPQNDLLGHPKIKLFVAHGGTNGVQEAMYHGVPILGVPLLFDQRDNLFRIQARQAGKILDIFNMKMTEEIFYQGIQEVLTEPSYRMNMQRLSRLHRDTPIKPLDNALFWIEFVMRHKGAAHLRTESYKMPWYSYHSLDVFLFLAGVLLLVLLTVITLIRCLFISMCKKKVKRE